MLKSLAPAFVAATTLAMLSSAALADTVTVVTSFPKELTEAYKKAYESKYPNDKVEILNKGTSAGIAYVREQAAGSRPEIFWASAPDAFEVLASEKLLQKVDVSTSGIPEKIGSYPINDPEGFYRGQALAGYGLMWNTRYLQANKIPVPKEWADLTKPVYHGHVATSSPSRSGTTHLTYETILQGEGWDKGWNQILQIAGNSAAVTERSFGVPDGVSNGQFGIGLVIDFFGLAAKNSGFPVEFAYPSVTSIVPANIALVAGAKNADAGKRFLQYTLSDGRAATAPRSEDLAAAGAAGNVFESARGLSESVWRDDSGQGELRLRPVRVALLRGLLALRPDHYFPSQGAAGGHQGDPGCGKTSWRTREPATRGGEEARVESAHQRPAGAGQGVARDLQGDEGR